LWFQLLDKTRSEKIFQSPLITAKNFKKGIDFIEKPRYNG